MDADKRKGKEKEATVERLKLRSPAKDTSKSNEEGRDRSHGPVPQAVKDGRTVGDKSLTTEAGAQGQADEIGLEGLTIVLHMKGRDDLVINTDLRNLE